MVEPVIAPTLFTVVLLVLVGLAVVRYMHRRSRGAGRSDERDAVTPPERRGTFHRGSLDARTGGDRSRDDRTRERRRAANE